MFESLIATVSASLATNSFFTGGFYLGVLAYLATQLKNLPNIIWRYIKRTFTTKLEVSSYDGGFEAFVIWLSSHEYSKTARSVTASGDKANLVAMSEERQATKMRLYPAPGYHWLKHNGRWMMLHISRQEEVTAGAQRPVETISFTVWGRDIKFLNDLLKEVREGEEIYYKDKSFIWIQDRTYWTQASPTKKRPLESVILPDKQVKEVYEDVKTFLASKDWYANLGIPFHKGYLLEGEKGTGKSSLINAIAYELNLSLYLINLSSDHIDDEGLLTLMSSIRENSIVVIEDIDSLFNGRENKTKSNVTFSGLLNALDGISTKEGYILFMTTNHPEHLDGALIRPGRIDYRIRFDFATEEQKEKMFLRFFPLATEKQIQEFLEGSKEKELTTAQLQSYLLTHKDSVENALTNINKLEKQA